jgi:outer membrane protein assembly factor BamB
MTATIANANASLPLRARGWTVFIASLAFPPLGAVLLWMRPWRGWKSLLLRPLGTLGIAALGLAHLLAFYGMRVEVDGTGMRPIFTFRDPVKNISRLEEHRAQQQKSAPPAPAEQAQAAMPAAAEPAEAQQSPASAKPADAAARAATSAAYWTDFRGPLRDGIYREMAVLESWPAKGLQPMWKQPVGGGYASFVVGEGRAFTIEQRRENEVVAAYDLRTGRELWTHSYPAHFQESMGGDGPRATPVWHEGRVYSLGATGELRCLEATSGGVVWAKNILSDNNAENLQWGMAASPLIVDEKVIVQPGGRDGRSVVAYHKRTGQRVWSALSDRQAYTAPMLATLAGRRQVTTVSAERALGLAPEDGALLWSFPWTTEYDVNAAQPVVVDESHLFLSAGYGHGAALLEITRDAEKFAARAAWLNIGMKNKFSSSVLRDGFLYGLDESILACLEARSGQRCWKGGRYGYGQLLLAGDRIIVITEDGDLALVRATPEKFDELARFSAISGKTWNHMAISGGILLVRNESEMAAFRIAP